MSVPTSISLIYGGYSSHAPPTTESALRSAASTLTAYYTQEFTSCPHVGLSIIPSPLSLPSAENTTLSLPSTSVFTICQKPIDVTTFCVAPSGTQVIAGTSSGLLHFWFLDFPTASTLPQRQVISNAPARELAFHSFPIADIATALLDRSFFAIDTSGVLSYWDYSGCLLRSFRFPSAPSHRLSLTSLGTQLLVAHDGLYVSILDLYSSAINHIYPPHHRLSQACPITWAPNRLFFATSYKQGFVAIFSVKSSSLIAFLPVPAQVTALSFSPNGAFLAIADSCLGIQVWQVSFHHLPLKNNADKELHPPVLVWSLQLRNVQYPPSALQISPENTLAARLRVTPAVHPLPIDDVSQIQQHIPPSPIANIPFDHLMASKAIVLQSAQPSVLAPGASVPGPVNTASRLPPWSLASVIPSMDHEASLQPTQKVLFPAPTLLQSQLVTMAQYPTQSHVFDAHLALTSNGTVHTNRITSISFSYVGDDPTGQNFGLGSIPIAASASEQPSTFAQVLATTSLDGSVKYWYIPALYSYAIATHALLNNAAVPRASASSVTANGIDLSLLQHPRHDEVTYTNLDSFLLQTVHVKNSSATKVMFTPDNQSIICATSHAE